ncbi:MAG: biotin--[acetyl-CoA-carboxylase] ligase [Flavobacteriales bacterium]|nr:biotin--[acetyl-CoA-carboxylase] ligase [Flavobacteriales bacterium]
MSYFGHPCIYLSNVESTNNYLADHPDLDSLTEGTAILTYDQRDGRGQFGKKWSMRSGKDIAISVLLRPDLTNKRAFYFNKAICVGVSKCLESLLNMEVKVKWPNDVFVYGRKIAGILVEPSWSGNRCRQAIVGVGLNVNSETADRPFPAISILEVLDEESALSHVVDALVDQLERSYDLFRSGRLDAIENEYQSRLMGRGEKVPYREGQKIGIAKLIRVDDTGRIILETDEQERSWAHREIEIDYSGIIG